MESHSHEEKEPCPGCIAAAAAATNAVALAFPEEEAKEIINNNGGGGAAAASSDAAGAADKNDDASTTASVSRKRRVHSHYASSHHSSARESFMFSPQNYCHLRRSCNGSVSDELIRRLPKTDLHLHLDGSVRLTTLIDLAKEHNIQLPAYTDEGLRETVFKKNYRDLTEYLQGFFYMDGVLQTPGAVERVSYELAVDCFEEGIRYFEVRFAPHLHANDEFSSNDVVRSVNKGLLRAKTEYNARPAIVDGSEPRFEYGMILIAMRCFTAGTSQYFRRLAQVHPDEEQHRLYELASSALARCAVTLHSEGLPIVALDIAGAEAGFPAKTHREAFEYCHRNFLHKTVHAGEAYGPESIFQAITYLHADRIGHGTNIFRADMIKDPAVQDKEHFCSQLANFLADRNLTVEACLTSNLQTLPDLQHDAKNHPLRRMLDCHMAVCLNTDNRTVSDTTICKELALARDAFGLNPKEIRHLIFAGFKGCFFPGPSVEKHKYVHQILQYYDKLEHEAILAAARKARRLN